MSAFFRYAASYCAPRLCGAICGNAIPRTEHFRANSNFWSLTMVTPSVELGITIVCIDARQAHHEAQQDRSARRRPRPAGAHRLPKGARHIANGA